MEKTAVEVGPYRARREILRDAFGIVYEARHPRLDCPVAVRAIGRDVARDVSFSRRFLLELHAYEALEHPAIPRLYELSHDLEAPYMVTELVRGRTLESVLAGGTRLEPKGVVALLRPIADALDYAHARNTYHRDIRPANIMLADDGRTMLTGFGLGALATLTTGDGAAGTMAPDHMSPERLSGREPDGRSDVYSLAAVIFEAVTGRGPFASERWIETVTRRLYEPPPDACALVDGLPPLFGAVLREAMDRDPERRPATAGEMLDLLESALGPEEDVRAETWLLRTVRRTSVGVSAIVVAMAGAASLAWLLESPALSLAGRVSRSFLGIPLGH